MAEAGDNGTEVQAHTEAYSGFTRLMLWGTIGSFAIGAFVVLMIAG